MIIQPIDDSYNMSCDPSSQVKMQNPCMLLTETSISNIEDEESGFAYGNSTQPVNKTFGRADSMSSKSHTPHKTRRSRDERLKSRGIKKQLTTEIILDEIEKINGDNTESVVSDYLNRTQDDGIIINNTQETQEDETEEKKEKKETQKETEETKSDEEKEESINRKLEDQLSKEENSSNEE